MKTGKLKRGSDISLEAMWDEYSALCVDPEGCEASKVAARLGFYAGFTRFSSALSEAPDGEAEFLAWIEGFHAEIRTFQREMAEKAVDLMMQDKTLRGDTEH